jgi:hypothetical protein
MLLLEIGETSIVILPVLRRRRGRDHCLPAQYGYVS